ncbi:MAG: outer-membrane lipoprotein carrier protein LolA [Treponema sp.]|nr:outer-membrane lipoprotein carrier protein LolA [Treponema sp.]
MIIGFSILSAQEIVTAANYLGMVSDVYASLRDYEASVVIRSGNNDMTGTVSFRSPNFMRIDFTRPANQVIVFNGEALTVYLPEFRAVLTQDVPRRSSSSSAGLSMLRNNFSPAYLTGPNPEPLYSGSSERVIKLRLTRNRVSEGFREIILSINPETRLIRRIEGRTIAEAEIRIDFTSIRTNVGVPEARFAYDNPPNANMYHNFLFRDTD